MLFHAVGRYIQSRIRHYNNIRHPDVLTKILRALAYQIGSGVSYSEIAKTVQVDRKTVLSYIDLLEQAFIIFRLQPLTYTPRDVVKRQNKIYFYDNGIVNTLTGNYTEIDTGRDAGGLWENLMIAERRKYNLNHMLFKNSYYWRTHSGQEVDLVEEYNGTYHPYEIKWQKGKVSKGATAFATLYKSEPITVINNSDYLDFVR